MLHPFVLYGERVHEENITPTEIEPIVKKRHGKCDAKTAADCGFGDACSPDQQTLFPVTRFHNRHQVRFCHAHQLD